MIIISILHLGHRESIYLLLTGEHRNLGDHLLQLATHAFLKQYFSGYSVDEIPAPMWIRNRNQLMKKIHPEDLILISAGGFMGTLWPSGGGDAGAKEIIRSFPNNKIVLLPQTFFYHTNKSETIIENDASFYQKHTNVLLFTEIIAHIIGSIHEY